MSNRTRFESLAAYTARERESIVRLIGFSMNQYNQISLSDVALVADVLRYVLVNEKLVPDETSQPTAPSSPVSGKNPAA